MVVIFEFTKRLVIGILIILIGKYGIPEFPYYGPSIYKVASRDLNMIGNYDNRLTITIKYWIYAILAAFYKEDDVAYQYDPFTWFNQDSEIDPILQEAQLGAIGCIQEWLANDVVDSDGLILEGVKQASENIFKEISDANEHKRPVEFKVSPDYDYHVVARSLQFNDFANYRCLLERLDKLEVNT